MSPPTNNYGTFLEKKTLSLHHHIKYQDSDNIYKVFYQIEKMYGLPMLSWPNCDSSAPAFQLIEYSEPPKIETIRTSEVYELYFGKTVNGQCTIAVRALDFSLSGI